MNEGGGKDPFGLPSDPLITNGLGTQFLTHLASFLDHHSHHRTLALRQAFTNLAAAFAFCFSNSPHAHHHHHHHSRKRHPFPQLHLMGASLPQCPSLTTLFSHNILTCSIKHLISRVEHIHSLPLLSLAAALPPFHNLTSNMLAIAPEDAQLQMLGSLDQRPCNVDHRAHAFPDFSWVRHIVEPRTGIEFPGVLDSILAKDNQSNLSSEVLVGTGSRTMTIIKIKSLKVYAFGFYVHPYSVCQKLASKYGTVPVAELKERNDFYGDLLREDIGMTVRFVVNCNGMKINAVKDAFEKSLRARLVKTDPETDFKCIATFGSYFSKDIPLPVGTIIDFRRTSDGQLITEIGGNQIGAVHSRELCRAFFGMYIGEVPVSEQTKEEIGRNVASIITRC